MLNSQGRSKGTNSLRGDGEDARTSVGTRSSSKDQILPGTKAYRVAVGKLLRADISYDEFIARVEGKSNR